MMERRAFALLAIALAGGINQGASFKRAGAMLMHFYE
jgi:hypothetical protein